MNETKPVEVSELVGSPQFVFQPSISTIIAQGAVTVAIELGGALVIWQITRLVEAYKRPAK